MPNPRPSDVPLDSDAITAALADLEGWTLEDGAIVRTYATTGWKASLMLVNAIGFLSEAAWHHPDITLSWGRVKVSLWTHTANGVTGHDIALALQIEALISWRPDDGVLEGPPPSHAMLDSDG